MSPLCWNLAILPNGIPDISGLSLGSPTILWLMLCNKQEPECSQCIRAGKKCPGYRDQLSLMFRDETVKVRKKFEDGSGDSHLDGLDGDAGELLSPDNTSEHSMSSASDTSADPAVSESSTLAMKTPSRNWSGGHGRKDETDTDSFSPMSSQRLGEVLEAFADNLVAAGNGTSAKPDMDIRSKKQLRRRSQGFSSLTLHGAKGGTTYENIVAAAQMATVQAMLRGPGQTPAEQGLHFYLEHYLYGHPESPPKGGDVAVHIPWILDPSARLIASAVGLAGLGNLAGNDQTRITSWQNYLTGLQMTALTLKTPGLDTLNNAMRCVILMAMFEYVTSTYREKPKDDQIMTELLLLLCELTNLLVYVQSQALIDTRPDIAVIVVQALQLESRLITWELEVSGEGIWKYEECEIVSLPPQACFKGRFHRYSDISTARIWSYYRWARILVNELLLEFIEKCPISVATALIQLGDERSLSANRSNTDSPEAFSSPSAIAEVDPDPIERLRSKALRIIRKCAEDTFASTPTNWRHPSIPLSEYAQIATKAPAYGANGGTGVITLMPTLFHLQTAACAPGIPYEDWKWALDVIDTVWAYLGLQQARSLADQMRAHHDAQVKRVTHSGI
ncbi:fungal zn binuclear cluster domain containing protein [Ophiostoma piceae UAMH 11346]|uniref:Fungal zn binuclear cluster domain containing protein n=1 Tax=Ophiostoma piceae (strain UAMH 11346) TaxID=1262450 RepID=S3CDD3_OPHP1|nr:fungal zn binuclear cluster domain containing protein [Ophiostoma piceae UAMH 11346]